MFQIKSGSKIKIYSPLLVIVVMIGGDDDDDDDILRIFFPLNFHPGFLF